MVGDAAAAVPSGQIVLHITTQPEGAVVEKNGFQVCDKSPCDVLASPGEAVSLTAKLGAKTGKAKVLAQREQSVNINLGAAVSPGSKLPRPSPGPAPERMCEVDMDGLKILRPCK